MLHLCYIWQIRISEQLSYLSVELVGIYFFANKKAETLKWHRLKLQKMFWGMIWCRLVNKINFEGWFGAGWSFKRCLEGWIEPKWLIKIFGKDDLKPDGASKDVWKDDLKLVATSKLILRDELRLDEEYWQMKRN